MIKKFNEITFSLGLLLIMLITIILLSIKTNEEKLKRAYEMGYTYGSVSLINNLTNDSLSDYDWLNDFKKDSIKAINYFKR